MKPKRFAVTEVWVRQFVVDGLSESEVLEQYDPQTRVAGNMSELSLSNWHAIEVPPDAGA